MKAARSSAAAPDLPRRVAAELVGTALLLAIVVGSGIMAERSSGGNVGFIAAQVIGAAAATLFFRWLVPNLPAEADRVVVATDRTDAA